MKLLYSKLEKRRKPQYLLSTKIYQDKDSRFVRKLAVDPSARNHIRNLYARTMTFMHICSFLSFPKIYKHNSSYIDFEYIRYPSLTQSIHQALLDQNYQGAFAYIKKMKQFFSHLPSDVSNPYLFSGFTKRFDPPQTYKSNKNQRCLLITPLDLTFDNILSQDDEYFAVDVEWLYDFPIPTRFVAFRALYYLCVSLQPVLQKHASFQFPCFEIMNNICIPVSWLTLWSFTEEEISRFLMYEQHFQEYVLVTPHKFHPDMVFQKMRIRGPFYRELMYRLGNVHQKMNTKRTS